MVKDMPSGSLNSPRAVSPSTPPVGNCPITLHARHLAEAVGFNFTGAVAELVHQQHHLGKAVLLHIREHPVTRPFRFELAGLVAVIFQLTERDLLIIAGNPPIPAVSRHKLWRRSMINPLTELSLKVWRARWKMRTTS